MHNIVSLDEVKLWMNITGQSKNEVLEMLILQATQDIERFIEKPVVLRQNTEYRDGNGKRDLLLNQYPVYKIDSLYSDTDRAWASDTAIASDDYFLRPDVGIVTLYNDEAIFTKGHGNIRIIYWAGYSRFTVIAGDNNYLDISDSGGTAAIQITAGEYSPDDLASAIQTALNADATLNSTAYTVTYSALRQKFTFGCDEAFSLLWNGTNSLKSIGSLLGFDSAANQTTKTSYIANASVNGVPSDFKIAALKLIERVYRRSAHGDNNQDKVKESNKSGTNIEFVQDRWPKDVVEMLKEYKRHHLPLGVL